MAEPLGLAALALDAAFGWPDRLYRRVGHPVGGFARLIAACERRWNGPERPPATRRLLGLVTMLLLVTAAVAAGLALEVLARTLGGRWWWAVAAPLAWPGLAQHSLHAHVQPVAGALAAGELAAARTAVARIVGRDVAALDEAGIARAGIESLAESFCDGVVAPLFWLLLLGLPGLWAYKAINTADSLIGHREPRWRAFGWAAARMDDGANWLPARLSGVLLCLAAGGGWRTMRRDAGLHASPNAGWPEAAMAGALGVVLAGPVAYDGRVHARPWIGGGGRAPEAGELGRALAIYRRACALLWVVAGGVAWLR